MIPYHNQDKWGYLDSNNKIVMPAQFDTCSVFQKNLAVVKIGGKYGVINSEGKYVIKAKNHLIKNNTFSEFFEVYKKPNSIVKCKDYYGQKTDCIHIVSCGYRSISRSHPNGREISINENNKFALVFLNRQYDVWPEKIPKEYLDTTDFVFSSVEFYGQTLQLIKRDSLFGIYDPSEVNPTILCNIQEISEQEKYHDAIEQNLNKYKMNDKWGIINYKGLRITEAIYKEIYFTEDHNLVLVKTIDNNYHYIDKDGKEYIKKE